MDLAQFHAGVSRRIDLLVRSLREESADPLCTLVAAPGKRLRSAFLYALASGGRADPERLIRVSAAIEILHIATLLHDDVVDRADTRRGSPTSRTLFGDERALLAGLAAFALAGREAADLGPGLASAFARASMKLANGHLLDVERAFDTNMTLDQYVEMATGKTSALFELAAVAAGAEAHLEVPVRQALVEWAIHFGAAFQILDDCLDLDPQASDKTPGLDHLRGLFGAPTLLALAQDDGALRARLLDVSTDRSDLEAIRDMIVARGGLSQAYAHAGHFARRADDTLRVGDAHSFPPVVRQLMTTALHGVL